jgi:transcriptional regulator GlxA family with amidase domain
MACLTSIIEPLRAANEISDFEAFAWQLISETDGPVLASADIAFGPQFSLDAVNDLDQLILLSPPSPIFSNSRSTGHMRSRARHGTQLGAASGGVFPLVAFGAVFGEKVSVHWYYEAAFAAIFPDHAASDQVLEIGPKVITASGAAAAFNLALHLIETQLGSAMATEFACWFQHPMMRKANVQQVLPRHDVAGQGAQLPDHVSRAIALFSADMSEPLQIGTVADSLGISPRQLERTFKKATGFSPKHYYRKMHMDAVRQIVTYTNDGLADVAASVGYPSIQALNKHYQAAFGVTSVEDRTRVNLYRVDGNWLVPSI